MNIAALLAEHGSPLWLVDLDRVRERWRGFRDAFDACWPDVEIAYSYKTNRVPAILRTLAAEGAVSGPLCLNVDVLHPATELPHLAAGDVLLVREVGAYQQTQSTQFGDLRPAVVAFDAGCWTSCARRETLEDLLAADAEAVLTTVGALAGDEEEQP